MEPQVVVVGAGVAGLSAAGRLLEAGIEPLILEASAVAGGRVRALEGFAGFPIELGAEEIHGPENSIFQLAKSRGAEVVRHFTTDDMIRLDGKLCFLDQAERDADVRKAMKLIDGIGSYRGENRTVQEHLIRTHFPRRAWHYLDSRLGVEHGRELQARAVIVTSSLRVLRDGLIAFNPALPSEITSAMNAIGMDTGMKVILRFRQRFWDERMYFLHTDGFLPQYWAAGKGRSEDGRVLTAFVGGARAESLAEMGVDPAAFALGELDEVFGSRSASRCFESAFVADWGAEPYVRGLYSYPTTKTRHSDREALARPLDGKLFFAGEATNTAGHGGTVHGAMETGWRAAREVIAAFMENSQGALNPSKSTSLRWRR